ncbi:helix-turn-helix domain-containing protein [Lysinibacillus xylanilyticus]|uniref:helix-turn-helix domain-containing protein n=1 Tax=Lysinibacillus xylanilyticus TaxID=582475 RepID=UPI003803344C
MLNQLGKIIRASRTQKGISINDYAAKLGVSAGYLSNLETGKTDTVNLSLLEKLNEDLFLFQNGTIDENLEDHFHHRLKIVNELLNNLKKTNPEEAEYLLSFVEKGIELFIKR